MMKDKPFSFQFIICILISIFHNLSKNIFYL